MMAVVLDGIIEMEWKIAYVRVTMGFLRKEKTDVTLLRLIEMIEDIIEYLSSISVIDDLELQQIKNWKEDSEYWNIIKQAGYTTILTEALEGIQEESKRRMIRAIKYRELIEHLQTCTICIETGIEHCELIDEYIILKEGDTLNAR